MQKSWKFNIKNWSNKSTSGWHHHASRCDTFPFPFLARPRPHTSLPNHDNSEKRLRTKLTFLLWTKTASCRWRSDQISQLKLSLSPVSLSCEWYSSICHFYLSKWFRLLDSPHTFWTSRGVAGWLCWFDCRNQFYLSALCYNGPPWWDH